MKHSKKLLGGLAVIASAGLMVGTTVPANADPTRPYAAVGSDTIQDVWNALTADTLDSTGGVTASAYASSIASYDAFDNNGDAYQIKTKALGPWFVRPSGSGEGVKALSASWNSAGGNWSKAPAVPAGTASCTPTPCTATYTTSAVTTNLRPSRSVDFARSSSGASGTGGPLTYIPMARDAVTVAFKDTATNQLANLDLSTNQLKELYTGVNDSTDDTGSVTVTITGTGASAVPTINGITVQPQIPQIGSGTRKFFLQAIGFTDIATDGSSASLAAYIPLRNATTGQNGNPENNGTVLVNAGDLIPFSAAQWIAQGNLAPGVTNTTTGVSLAKINGNTAVTGNPTVLNPDGSVLTAGTLAPSTLYGASTLGKYSQLTTSGVGVFARDVFDVVPTAFFSGTSKQVNLTNILTGIQGDGTAIPIVKKFGFGILASYANDSSTWKTAAYSN